VIEAEQAIYTIKRMCELLGCHAHGSTNGAPGDDGAGWIWPFIGALTLPAA
jgi:hypothetical protein